MDDDLARKNGCGDGPAQALEGPSAADLAAAEVRGGKAAGFSYRCVLADWRVFSRRCQRPLLVGCHQWMDRCPLLCCLHLIVALHRQPAGKPRHGRPGLGAWVRNYFGKWRGTQTRKLRHQGFVLTLESMWSFMNSFLGM
jgi:hypothetical protein